MSPEALATLRELAEERFAEARGARDDAAAELERAEQLHMQSLGILVRARAGLEEAQRRVYVVLTAVDALEAAQSPHEPPQEPPAPAQGVPGPGEDIDPGGIFVEVEA